MGIFDDLFKTILSRFVNEAAHTADYLQYHHRGSCKIPCYDCPERHKRVYKNGKHVRLPAHIRCDCYYENVETISLGTVSDKGNNGPDFWIATYGKLPDYYITKEEAKQKYGWDNSKNTLASKAPGMMIGGDIFHNRESILPEKLGRIWYECDIDYVAGSRLSARLYYSNDGLMFYSPDHLSGNVTVCQVK